MSHERKIARGRAGDAGSVAQRRLGQQMYGGRKRWNRAGGS
jgi:hypothetical protein